MKTGSIVMVRNETLLARGIRWFMKLYGKLTGRDTPVRYNHAEIIIDPYTYGSRKHGVEMSHIDEYYKGQTYLVLELKRPYSMKECDRLINYVHEKLGTRYEYMNFISWIAYICTLGTVKLSKHTDKKMECFEFVARAANAVRPGTFQHPEYTSYFDIVDNVNYRHE